MFRFTPLRRLHCLLTPPASFVRAFVHTYLSASSPSQALQAQNTALQNEVTRLQSLLLQAEPFPFLQAAMDAVPDGVVIYNFAPPLALNPAAQQLFGIASGEPFHLSPNRLLYPSGQSVPPGAVPWVRAAHAQISLDWTPYLLARSTHDPCPVEIAAYSLPGGAVGIVRDVSVQKGALARETLSRHAQQTLAETARQLSRTSDLDGACQIITDSALALLPPETRSGAQALLCTFDGQGSPLVVRSLSPARPPKKPRRHADTLPPEFEFDAQSPLLWAVYLDRNSVISANINTDSRFDQPRERALLHSPRELPRPVTSALMLPLLPGAAASGHLLLTSPLPDAFPPALQEMLTVLSALSASVLARAQGDRLCRGKDNQLDAMQQAVAATPGPAHLFADTLARCAAAALGAAVCALSRREDVPDPTPETDSQTLQTWGQSPPDAAVPLPARRAVPGRCACARTTQNAFRREAASWQVGIPNPPLGECAWRAFGGQSGTHSALAVPVRRADAVCGALTLVWHGSKSFSPQDIRLAETFAALASLAC